MSIPSKIFNTEKSDYENTPLFLGQDNGLIDTVNKRHPRIWNLYKKLKAQDWDENEFPFSTCKTEFKTCSKSIYDAMIRTLAWQWEADSQVARGILPIMAPFISSSELYTAWTKVTENECTHSLAYSEIVRESFDNPDDVLKEILSVKESFDRLSIVANVMEKAYFTSHKYALGMVGKTQETYNDIFLFVVALFALERIQFMSSFAITFTIADSGLFTPIGKSVQKICQDELEIHVEIDKAVLDHELTTEFGLMAFNKLRAEVLDIINSVVNAEFVWSDDLFSNGRELTGVNPEALKQWVLYNAKFVYDYFGLTKESGHTFPSKNPMPFLDEWIRIDGIQPSPQEERNGQYLLGAVVNDLDNNTFSQEFTDI